MMVAAEGDDADHSHVGRLAVPGSRR
jgi:hypothetical protein